ncbi:MAG: GNAT family N-acetyltransferase [Burkholderiaceae bacterium]|nr:GNAT family N-acetyltransferase [Burkholderiaceae bacterium]
MVKSAECWVKLGTWDRMRDWATPIRMQVFVLEQRVAPQEELDDMDVACLHAVAFDAQGRAQGTGRLLPDGHIGRMAVLREFRGLGIGSAILDMLVNEARGLGYHSVALHAQTHARGFYERHGFVAEGDEFEEANIPHILMRRSFEAPDRET